ncbi:hypothetical protein PoB_000528300 [Plakobranchus ocellatus]|uniref:Uncharacterized protein n=1 Tax=Plakobranchus ocellatus TaxID=259542 RepID=A0AAV3Y8M0_9GAST|nr:hypothetical protein PoB_000528300 [Plakobranchus ocellatus]
MPSCPSNMTSGSLADYVSCSPKLVTQNGSTNLTQYLLQFVEINEHEVNRDRVNLIFLDDDDSDAEHIVSNTKAATSSVRQDACGEARTYDRRVPADLRADLFADVPSTLH